MKLFWIVGNTLICLVISACHASRPIAVSRQALPDPFASAGRKVLLGTQPGTPVTETLAVVVNEACLEKRASKNLQGWEASVLGEKVTFKGAGWGQSSRTQTIRIRLHDEMDEGALERAAQADACIQGVGANQAMSFNSAGPGQESRVEDPMASLQTHLAPIHASSGASLFQNQAAGLPGEVVIAVIDTGLDLTHPDLSANLWVNSLEAAGQPGIDDDGNGFVDDVNGYCFPCQNGVVTHQTVNDHGTHVAGLAAAISSNGVGGTGVMGRRVRVMVLNVFGSNWGTDTVDIDNAIRYAADNGADVINLSVGARGPSETTAAALTYAINRGVTVVSAAGNNSLDIGQDFYFPASYASRYPGLIAVAATDAKTGALCDFSNFGPSTVQIAAPGCDGAAPKGGLLSTRGAGQYGYKKGTSQASPLVAAAAALVVSSFRDQLGRKPTPAEVLSLLLQGSPVVESLSSAVTGGHRLDIEQLNQVVFKPASGR